MLLLTVIPVDAGSFFFKSKEIFKHKKPGKLGIRGLFCFFLSTPGEKENPSKT